MRIAEKPSREDTLLSFRLFASFCDGGKRKTDRRQSGGPADDPGSGNPTPLAGKVLLGKLPPGTALSSLETQQERMAAYEMARGATGSAFSFASTFAISHLAQNYYSGRSKAPNPATILSMVQGKQQP